MKSMSIRGLAIAVAIVACLIIPPSASARPSITDVFTGDGSPAGTVDSPAISCTVQNGGATDGQRWCSGAPSLVQSFDGTPIDVNVYLPPDPPGPGNDGNFPLVGMYHGWSGKKVDDGGAQRWLSQGYAVFAPQARGWYASCGTTASRTPIAQGGDLPTWATCANGTIQLQDFRYESHDYQYLESLLVDEGVVDPNRIGQQGGSYGGIASVTLGSLNDKTMNPDGTYVDWVSPGGTELHTAAATPSQLGSDVLYTQQPNGSFLDYAAWSPYFGPNGDARVGVQKYTVMNGFIATFLAGTNTKGNPGAELLALGNAANAVGPYDYLKPAMEQSLLTHGGYNVDRSITPSPMLLSDGINDDFVPVDESVKLYNKIRSYFPDVPVAMNFGDYGHARAQDKNDATSALRDRQNAWMNYYVRDAGAGTKPAENIVAYGFTCPDAAPSSGPLTFDEWADASSGEIRITDKGANKTIGATGSQNGASFSTPTGVACTTAPAADNPTSVNYRTEAAAGGGYTVSGATTLLMRLNVTGESDQLAARLLDVSPDGNERLVERGLLRPKTNSPKAVQVLQLHPNWWKVETGHQLKLELLGDDYPYSHLNVAGPDAAAQHPIEVKDIQIRIPTLEGPGASGGLVTGPLAKYLPPGYDAAAGFADQTTSRAPDFDSPVAKVKRVTSKRPRGKKRAKKATVTINFSSNDAGGTGAARYDCRLDKGDWRKCESPATYRRVKAGHHTFRVYATDGEGNVSETAVKQFRLTGKLKIKG